MYPSLSSIKEDSIKATLIYETSPTITSYSNSDTSFVKSIVSMTKMVFEMK